MSAPNAPSNLTVTFFSDVQVDLTWQDNSNNEDTFILERKLSTSSIWTEILDSGPNVTTYTDCPLTPGLTFEYRVKARNTDGDSAYAQASVTMLPLQSPPAPSNLTGTIISDSQIDLTWDDNAKNEQNYSIHRSVNSGSFSILGFLGSNATSFSDTDVSPGNTYTYFVRVINNAGQGETSQFQITIPLPTTTIPPTTIIPLTTTIPPTTTIPLTTIMPPTTTIPPTTIMPPTTTIPPTTTQSPPVDKSRMILIYWRIVMDEFC